MSLKSLQYAMMALLLVGSASLLCGCEAKPAASLYDYETLMTESSENRTITMMENGKRSYTFQSPLMEGYSMASNPYQEFRRGIKMTTYTDTLSLVDAVITANYAIYYERQRLWEAKGNVVIVKNNRKAGDTTVTGLTEIYTQQLFWNATTKKIYSNVDTKVLQPDGWHFGVGFDADEDLKNIHFRKYSSEMEFDMSQPEPKPAEESDDKTKETKKDAAKESNKSSSKATNEGGAKRPQNRPGAAPDMHPAPRTPQPRANLDGGAVDLNPTSTNMTRPERRGAKTPAEVEGAPKKPSTPSSGKRPEGVTPINRAGETPATLQSGAVGSPLRSGAKAGNVGAKRDDSGLELANPVNE